MTRILLVRHGATEWSATGRHTSRTDLALSADGRSEAAALRGDLQSYLGGREPALVLTSPMQRARETATLAGFGNQVVEDPDLTEMDYGDGEGRTTEEIRRERPGWTVWDGSRRRDDGAGQGAWIVC